MTENEDKGRAVIAIGADHAGFALKESLLADLRAEGYELHDFGTHCPDPVDYPDIGHAVAEAVASGRFERGIVICGTGVGITIAANKVKGIRAGSCSEPYSARMARAHNNANIIGMGGRVVGPGLALEIAKAFLETEFEAEPRHTRRVDKINAMDGC